MACGTALRVSGSSRGPAPLDAMMSANRNAAKRLADGARKSRIKASACYTSRASGGGDPRMKIKSQKDFWSGLMFIGSGLFFALWAIGFYQMGTAVRMGPAYFPTVLGFLLAVLGALVLLGSFTLEAEGDQAVHTPFNII